MGKPKSILATLWGLVTSVAAIAVLGWAAWYAYSHWGPASSEVSDSVQGAAFNCKKALAELATDYACMTATTCTMTQDEMSELKNREVDIEQYCN